MNNNPTFEYIKQSLPLAAIGAVVFVPSENKYKYSYCLIFNLINIKGDLN